MGLVHTPRVLASIARGLMKRRADPTAPMTGLGADHPYIYTARAGLFDIDYLGHLNNSAYLNHAELARWEMTAKSGVMQGMIKHQVNFLVAGSAIRYRREIRPLYRKFQIDTVIAALDDDKNIWVTQDFRYPNDRIRAQLVLRAVLTQGRSVIDPRVVFEEYAGLDKELVESLYERKDVLLDRYASLEESFRQAASDDDKKLMS